MNTVRGLLLFSSLAVLFLAGEQVAAKVYRVGILAPRNAGDRELQRALAPIRVDRGKNIRFDYRSTGGDNTRQFALAVELVALPVDLILTYGTPATLEA